MLSQTFKQVKRRRFSLACILGIGQQLL